MIKVTYLDHSGLMVETPKAILVFDYYRDPAHVLKKRLEKNRELPVVFFVSHHQGDHFNPMIFDLAQDCKRTFVLSYDIESKHVPDKGMQVAYMAPGDYIESIADAVNVRAFRSTGAGVCYLVTTPEGKTIFHGGDLNNVPTTEKTTERDIAKEVAEMNKTAGEVAIISPKVDIAMLADDSTLGSETVATSVREFLKRVKVANFFPMNLRGDFNKACDFVNSETETGTTFYCLDKPGAYAGID